MSVAKTPGLFTQVVGCCDGCRWDDGTTGWSSSIWMNLQRTQTLQFFETLRKDAKGKAAIDCAAPFLRFSCDRQTWWRRTSKLGVAGGRVPIQFRSMCSMRGRRPCIWVMSWANVGRYFIHYRAYGCIWTFLGLSVPNRVAVHWLNWLEKCVAQQISYWLIIEVYTHWTIVGYLRHKSVLTDLQRYLEGFGAS